MKPARLVDVNALPMRGVEMREDGLRIGALEKMSGVALHLEIVANYPIISQALLQSASPQIRNTARSSVWSWQTPSKRPEMRQRWSERSMWSKGLHPGRMARNIRSRRIR
jgi:hypothetical protein